MFKELFPLLTWSNPETDEVYETIIFYYSSQRWRTVTPERGEQIRRELSLSPAHHLVRSSRVQWEEVIAGGTVVQVSWEGTEILRRTKSLEFTEQGAGEERTTWRKSISEGPLRVLSIKQCVNLEVPLKAREKKKEKARERTTSEK